MSNQIIERFSLFAGTDGGIESWLTPETDKRIFQRLATIETQPLTRSQLNQLLLLGHEAPLSQGFFMFYWLSLPSQHHHPYDVQTLEGFSAEYFTHSAIQSIEHLRWGLYRFYVDALLYFGNVRQAYRQLRSLSYEAIKLFFEYKSSDFESPSGFINRGPPLPLRNIPKDDRYLISEMACKSFEPSTGVGDSMLETLATSYRKMKRSKNRKTFSVGELITGSAASARQIEMAFSAAEFVDEQVDSIAGLKKKYDVYKMRFDDARSAHWRIRRFTYPW